MVEEDVAVAVSGKVVAPVREEVIENAAATTTTAMSATRETPTVLSEVAARMATDPCVLRTAKVAPTTVVAEEAVAGAADMAKGTSARVGASSIVTAGTLEGELR